MTESFCQNTGLPITACECYEFTDRGLPLPTGEAMDHFIAEMRDRYHLTTPTDTTEETP